MRKYEVPPIIEITIADLSDGISHGSKFTSLRKNQDTVS
jgi:hypothetical protein